MKIEPEKFKKLTNSPIWTDGDNYIRVEGANWLEIRVDGTTLQVWKETAARPMRSVIDLSYIQLVAGPERVKLQAEDFKLVQELIEKTYREQNYPCEIMEPERVPDELQRVHSTDTEILNN